MPCVYQKRRGAVAPGRENAVAVRGGRRRAWEVVGGNLVVVRINTAVMSRAAPALAARLRVNKRRAA